MKTYFAIEKHYGLLDQMLVSGGNFLTLALCANYLPLEEQGKFIYIFSTYIGVVLLNVSGLFQGAAVRAPNQDLFYETVLARMQVLMAFLYSALLAVVWYLFGSYFGWRLTIPMVFLLACFLGIQQLADFKRRISYIFASSKEACKSSAFIYPIRIICIGFLRPDNIVSVLLILLITALIPATMTIAIAVKEKISYSSTTTKALDHLHFSWLFTVGSILNWLWSYAPIFLLGALQGKGAAALVASIRGISSVANIFAEQLETKAAADWARILHHQGENELKLKIAALNRIAFIFWLLVMLLVWFFGETIVTLLLGDAYTQHAYLLDIAWISYGAFFISRIYGIKHRTFGDNRIEFFAGMCGLLASVIGSFWLIPLYGTKGATSVYVLVAIVMYFSQVVFFRFMSTKNKSS